MMSLPVQHLSDEAIAAFADDVLGGHARSRAARHLADCAECRAAVAVQRDAARVLRASAAPVVPVGLLERLRELPSVTPLRLPPPGFQTGGPPPAVGVFPVALPAVPADRRAPARAERRFGRSHHVGLMTATAAVLALGAVAAGTTTLAGGQATPGPGTVAPARVGPAPTGLLGGNAPAFVIAPVIER